MSGLTAILVDALLVAAIVALLFQISRQLRATREARASEERFRQMAEHAPVILWMARPDTSLDFLNQTSVDFTGEPLQEILGEGWLKVVHPGDLDRVIAAYTAAFDARAPFTMEYRMRRADGQYSWVMDRAALKLAPDGSFAGYFGATIDITERIEAETSIRESRAALEASHGVIRQLAGRLIEAQDSERARIARDLHDDVSQQLAGLSIALSGLKHHANALNLGEEIQVELRSIHERTAALAQNVRHLSHDLHPTVLRHAGLVAAMNSYCAEIERAHGLASACRAEGDFSALPPEVALCLYRVAQEALRNVVAHAGANRAELRLLRSADSVDLTIADDGAGFDIPSTLQRGRGLGLVSIGERARFAGGTFDVTSEPRKGTRISIRIPLAPAPPNGTNAANAAELAPEPIVS